MRWWVPGLILFCASSTVFAQPSDRTQTHPVALGFTFEDTFLQDLPLSDSVYSVLEVMQPSIISDRFTEGGLFTAQPARVGGFQSSWTQTRFLVGDVDVSDPNGSGAPLLFPDLGPWQRVRVATGMLGGDVNSTGLVISLDPRTASTAWRHSASTSVSHGGLTGRASSLAEPTIARLGGRDRLAWTSAGPLSPRLSGSMALAWTRSSQFDRTEPTAADAALGSAFASIVYARDTGGSLQTVGWVERQRVPLDHRLAFGAADAATESTGAHVQGTWRSPAAAPWPWRAFAAYTQRSRSNDTATQGIVERLVDGPVSAVVSMPRGTVRQIGLGGRIERARDAGGTTHHLSGGLDLSTASQRMPASTIETIGETTDGVPSRVWRFRNPSSRSRRHSVSFSAHANDRVAVHPRLSLAAGLRIESQSGSADGAAQGIEWFTLLPRARLDWRLHRDGVTTVFVGYTRSAYRLALDLLAFGDPAAPTADLYRWDSRLPVLPAGNGPLVARVGPGTGGDPDSVRIDEALERPVADELAFGFEINPGPRARFQLAAVGRRETGFIGLANLGAPASAYAAFTVSDPGANTGSPDDDKVIAVYDRIPATFGRDRYLLTNTGRDASLSGNLELSGQWTTPRLTFFGGATASIAQGPAANRGYGPLENDQSAVSDTYVTPNDATFERGRLFNDRAFTIKLSGVYRLPADIRLGAIARYQDGQPFARMLVFPNLTQGAEAVRAFAAGDSRFRFIGTLDARVSKGFAIGRGRIDAVLDAYNLPGLTYDVEERAAAAPDDRTPIAIQPSRAFHVGVRVSF